MNSTGFKKDKVATDFKRIVGESEELLQKTAGTVSDQAHEVRKRLAEALEAARHTCHGLEDKAIESARTAGRSIREHPYQSIGVAFGIGLLIGLWARGK